MTRWRLSGRGEISSMGVVVWLEAKRGRRVVRVLAGPLASLATGRHDEPWPDVVGRACAHAGFDSPPEFLVAVAAATLADLPPPTEPWSPAPGRVGRARLFVRRSRALRLIVAVDVALAWSAAVPGVPWPIALLEGAVIGWLAQGAI